MGTQHLGPLLVRTLMCANNCSALLSQYTCILTFSTYITNPNLNSLIGENQTNLLLITVTVNRSSTPANYTNIGG